MFTNFVLGYKQLYSPPQISERIVSLSP